MTLKDQVAVVTGGGTGIGAATALALAEAGAQVAVGGRRLEPLEAVAARCSGPGTIRPHRLDVADRHSVEAFFSWVERELGPVAILVNAAGVNVARRTMRELDPADWDRLLQINATGAYNCTHRVLPGMRAAGRGTIVNISSVAGKRAGPLGGVAYNASKFAMTALGLSVAAEEAPSGIRVTNIYPGEVDTPILQQRPRPVSEEHRRRILQPEDVAAAVMLAVTLPPRAHVAELVIKPTTQVYV